MSTDKILSAVAITLLVIGPLHLTNALFGQQPITSPNVTTPPATRPPATKAPPTKAPATTTPATTTPAATTPATTTPATTTPATTTPGGKQPAILMLSEAECRDEKQSPKKECELGDIIFVTCDNLSAWMNDPSAKNTPKDLVLVLDGRVMKGRGAMGPYNSENELKFDLRRLEGDDVDGKANRDAWSALLRSSHGIQSMNVGLALGGNPPYYGPATIKFRVLPEYWGLGVAFLLLMLVFFFVLARRSDILRDGPTNGVGSLSLTSWRGLLKLWRGSANVDKKSFSLARCQMAWWFFIIVAAYIWIWMVTDDRDSLTQGALVLMGISAATGLGATLVDSSKNDQRQSLQNEKAALGARLGVLSTAIAATSPPPESLVDLKAEQQQKKARQTEIDTELASLPSPPAPSQGFLLDILRDETGVSFHRFQMASWTVVLGFVFAVAVYRSLAMPDFSATLLALMGISSGTYIGFKISDPPKSS